VSVKPSRCVCRKRKLTVCTRLRSAQVRLNLVPINLLSLDESSLSCAASATLLATSSSETGGELIGLLENAEGIDILVGLRDDLGHWGEFEGSRSWNCRA